VGKTDEEFQVDSEGKKKRVVLRLEDYENWRMICMILL